MVRLQRAVLLLALVASLSHVASACNYRTEAIAKVDIQVKRMVDCEQSSTPVTNLQSVADEGSCTATNLDCATPGLQAADQCRVHGNNQLAFPVRVGQITLSAASFTGELRLDQGMHMVFVSAETHAANKGFVEDCKTSTDEEVAKRKILRSDPDSADTSPLFAPAETCMDQTAGAPTPLVQCCAMVAGPIFDNGSGDEAMVTGGVSTVAIRLQRTIPTCCCMQVKDEVDNYPQIYFTMVTYDAIIDYQAEAEVEFHVYDGSSSKWADVTFGIQPGTKATFWTSAAPGKRGTSAAPPSGCDDGFHCGTWLSATGSELETFESDYAGNNLKECTPNDRNDKNRCTIKYSHSDSSESGQFQFKLHLKGTAENNFNDDPLNPSGREEKDYFEGWIAIRKDGYLEFDFTILETNPVDQRNMFCQDVAVDKVMLDKDNDDCDPTADSTCQGRIIVDYLFSDGDLEKERYHLQNFPNSATEADAIRNMFTTNHVRLDPEQPLDGTNNCLKATKEQPFDFLITSSTEVTFGPQNIDLTCAGQWGMTGQNLCCSGAISNFPTDTDLAGKDASEVFVTIAEHEGYWEATGANFGDVVGLPLVKRNPIGNGKSELYGWPEDAAEIYDHVHLPDAASLTPLSRTDGVTAVSGLSVVGSTKREVLRLPEAGISDDETWCSALEVTQPVTDGILFDDSLQQLGRFQGKIEIRDGDTQSGEGETLCDMAIRAKPPSYASAGDYKKRSEWGFRSSSDSADDDKKPDGIVQPYQVTPAFCHFGIFMRRGLSKNGVAGRPANKVPVFTLTYISEVQFSTVNQEIKFQINYRDDDAYSADAKEQKTQLTVRAAQAITLSGSDSRDPNEDNVPYELTFGSSTYTAGQQVTCTVDGGSVEKTYDACVQEANPTKSGSLGSAIGASDLACAQSGTIICTSKDYDVMVSMELEDTTTTWSQKGDVRYSTIKASPTNGDASRRLQASDTSVTTNTAVTTGSNPKPFGLDLSLRNGYLKASLGEGSTISGAAQAVADATGDAAAVAAGLPLPDDPTTLDQDDAVVGAAAAGGAAGTGAAGGLQSNQRVVLMTNGQSGSDMTTVAVIAGAGGAIIIVLALILVMVRRRGDQAGPQQQSVVYPVMPTSQIHGARHVVDPSMQGGFVTDKVEKVARSM